MNAHHYNPYTWSWDSGKTRPDEGTVDADSHPFSTGVALSAFAASTMVAGTKTSITDLAGDLLAFIYSAFIPELLIPHLAVCQRFRNVLLGVHNNSSNANDLKYVERLDCFANTLQIYLAKTAYACPRT